MLHEFLPDVLVPSSISTYPRIFTKVYVPSMMVVGLSWMNFWIDIEAVPARISLGLLTVLTTATQVKFYNEN